MHDRAGVLPPSERMAPVNLRAPTPREPFLRCEAALPPERSSRGTSEDALDRPAANGGLRPSNKLPRHTWQRGQGIGSGMYMLNSHFQYQKHLSQPKEPMAITLRWCKGVHTRTNRAQKDHALEPEPHAYASGLSSHARLRYEPEGGLCTALEVLIGMVSRTYVYPPSDEARSGHVRVVALRWCKGCDHFLSPQTKLMHACSCCHPTFHISSAISCEASV